MSLGWQGESALLPRKAKPINVDSKSMMRLKATILDEQQKLSFRQTNKTPRLRDSRGARVGEKKDVFKDVKNAGLEERKRRDLEDSDINKLLSQDKVASTLAVKAKIYDELKSGQLTVGKSSSDMLINFDEKKRGLLEKHTDKSLGNMADSGRFGDEEVDELGRMPKRSRLMDDHVTHATTASTDASSATLHKYEWSQGRHSVDDLDGEEVRDFSADREYTRMIEGRILAAAGSAGAAPVTSVTSASHTSASYARSNQDKSDCASYYGPNSADDRHRGADVAEPLQMSASSRVKSQWEKTLQGESRAHLDSIHRETETARQQHMYDRHSSGGRSASGVGYFGTTDVGDDSMDGRKQAGGSKNTQLDIRREMLRRKQLERKLKGVGGE